jgi:hypothetical protein
MNDFNAKISFKASDEIQAKKIIEAIATMLNKVDPLDLITLSAKVSSSPTIVKKAISYLKFM